MEKILKECLDNKFYKVELVSIVEPLKCSEELDRMLSCAEEILKRLNYHTDRYYFYRR